MKCTSLLFFAEFDVNVCGDTKKMASCFAVTGGGVKCISVKIHFFEYIIKMGKRYFIPLTLTLDSSMVESDDKGLGNRGTKYLLPKNNNKLFN